MSNKKDPAALFYIDTWLSATAEMDSDVRGWYLNLILHQFDKKDLPNDVEKLAVLAGVKFSEFERFKQMLNQVLMQKFKQNDNGRLENGYAKSILEGRELFKDKRAKSGNIGVIMKLAMSINGFKQRYLDRLKSELYDMELEDIEKHKDKQVLEQMLKLYINGDGNEDKDISNSIIPFDLFWNLYNKKLSANDCKVKWDKLDESVKKKIMETLPTFLKAHPDRQFLPHPKTYLNQQRWNDEIALPNQPIERPRPDMTTWSEKQIYVWRTRYEEGFSDLYRSAEANQFIATKEEKTGRYKDYFDQETLRFKSNQE